MMINIEKWIPLKDIPDTIYIESITDDINGLRILFKGESESNKSFEMIFSNYYGYRNFNESERLKTLNNSPGMTVKWGLFKAKNTDFTKWLCEESLEIVRESDIEHYIITTPDDILEVLSIEPPVLNIL